MNRIEQLIGVYDADGGLLGELRYLTGKLTGASHCTLCDITHSPVRRKRAWDALVARLALPVVLLHRNELDDHVAAAARRTGLPAVFARTVDGAVHPLLGPDRLAAAAGSVVAFEAALLDALASAPA